MKLYLDLATERLKVTHEYFFRMAYVWKFNKFVSVSDDVRNYDTFGIIPQYVADYLTFIQEGQTLPTPPMKECSHGQVA